MLSRQLFICMSTMSTTASKSDELMHTAANALSDVGFKVTDRQPSGIATKVVGYSILHDPPRFSFPKERGVKLQHAMRWNASRPFVQVSVVHSLTGIWLHGALLRRELLSVPFHLFRFLETCQNQTVRWWKSAQKGFLTMASLICYMEARVNLQGAHAIWI